MLRTRKRTKSSRYENMSCKELTSLIAGLFSNLNDNLGKPKDCPNISNIPDMTEWIPVAINTDGDCFFHALTVWYGINNMNFEDSLRQIIVNNLIAAIKNDDAIRKNVNDLGADGNFEEMIQELSIPGHYTTHYLDILISIVGDPDYQLLPVPPDQLGTMPRLCIYNKTRDGVYKSCQPFEQDEAANDMQSTITLFRYADHYSLLLTKDQAEVLRSQKIIEEQAYYGGKRHHTRKRRNNRLYGKTARKGKGNKQTSSIRKLALKTLKKESIQNIKKTVCWIFNSKQQKKCNASFDKSYIKSFMQAKKKQVSV